ncbi:MAG: DUF1080 domain-containing protein [Deltaproteobacteria bacterium]|nr:MAG: DUF1080 domain-containing protein [Deltaproteobacteria bacterium]
MRLLLAAPMIGVLTILVGAVAADEATRPKSKETTWTFDADKADKPPAGFSFGRTGQGKEGKWVVLAVKDAPSSGNVLAQTDGDKTDYRFPVAVADSPSLADVALSVKCKPVSGEVDQGCGLVFRYQDANNYYLTRANALEDNVRFYYVKNGQREQIKSWSGKVKSGVWHDYKIEAKGDRFVITFDGKKVLEATDKTFSQPGKVGVWTKADSVIYFDDLKVEPR